MRSPQHKTRCRRLWLIMVSPQGTGGTRRLSAPSDDVSTPAPVPPGLQVAPRRAARRACGQGRGVSRTDRAQGQSRGTQSRTPRKEEVSLGRGLVRAEVLGRGGRAFKVSATVHDVKGALSREQQEVTLEPSRPMRPSGQQKLFPDSTSAVPATCHTSTLRNRCSGKDA